MLFSCIIPVYNRFEELVRAADSVCAQSFQDFEVIIVDDGSSDVFVRKIDNYIASNNANIRLIRHAENKNGAAARNTGIKNALGEYVCFLDSDDVWQKDKLSELVNVIESKPQKTLLIHHQYCNVEQTERSDAFPLSPKLAHESVAEYSFIRNKIGGIQSSTICVSAKTAKKNLFNEKLKGHQDWDFCLKVEPFIEEFVFIPKVLTERYLGAFDHVSAKLDANYSMLFFMQYRRYFSSKAASAYLFNIVLPKIIDSNQIVSLMSSSLFANTLIRHPLKTSKKLIDLSNKIINLNIRTKKLEKHLKRKGVNSIAFWGANKYSLLLKNRFQNKYENPWNIDAKAAHAQESFMKTPIKSINSLSQKELERIDVLILSTDKHASDMKKQLAELRLKQSPAVIEF